MSATKKPAAAKAAKKKTVVKETEARFVGDGVDHVNGPAQPEETQDDLQKTSDEKALVELPQNNGIVVIGGMSTEVLKQGLEAQTEQRALIKEFVKKHLEDGVDFGRIHVLSKDKCPNPYSCDKDYHYSKPVLFKPGQEKLFSLFQITAKLERDEEAYKMLPDIKNLVAYKCVMYRGNEIVGEGRGSAVVNEKGRDANATIKIAEKRARMDACLSLGFSEFFAQDLDDPDYRSQAEMANQQAAARAEMKDKDEFGLFPRDPQAAIDAKERELLFRMILNYGVDKYYVIDALKLNDVKDPTQMTSGQARALMALIKSKAFKKPDMPKPAADPDPEDDLPTINVDEEVDNFDPNAADFGPSPSPIKANPDPDPELVVDEEFKGHVVELFDSMALNSRGKQWFMQKVAGKPWATFEKLTDNEWRRAYEIIMDIGDLKIDVDDSYMMSTEDAASHPNPDRTIESAHKQNLDSVQAVIPGAEVII